AGEHDRLDRAAARRAARIERGRAAQLLREIRRGIDEHPVLAICGNGEAGLSTRPGPWIASPSQLAHRAPAVPLRETPTRRRAKHDCGETSHQAELERDTGLKLGRQVAVDLETNTNLNENWRGPHDLFLSFPCTVGAGEAPDIGTLAAGGLLIQEMRSIGF